MVDPFTVNAQLMVAVPGDPPFTTPVEGSMVAIQVLPLLQEPPAVASSNGDVPPVQTLKFPVIGATVGGALTVTVIFAASLQPVATIVTVSFIVAVPAATPVTTPVTLFTVATPIFRLLQAPPVVASERLVVLAMHTLVFPVIAATTGKGLIFKFGLIAEHPPAVVPSIL